MVAAWGFADADVVSISSLSCELSGIGFSTLFVAILTGIERFFGGFEAG